MSLIKQPQKIHTAFNNVIFQFNKDLNAETEREITFKALLNNIPIKELTLKKEYFNNVAEFDLSGILKDLFRNNELRITGNNNTVINYDYNLFVEYTVTYTTTTVLHYGNLNGGGLNNPFENPNGNNPTQTEYKTTETTLKFCAINSVLQLGEIPEFINDDTVLLSNLPLKFYDGYPLKISVLGTDGENKVQVGNVGFSPFVLSDGKLIYTITLNKFADALYFGDGKKVGLLDYENKALTDNSGNYIILKSAKENKEGIKIQSGCTGRNPFYLRWINSRGGWDCWMFSVREVLQKSLSDVSVTKPYSTDISQSGKAIKKDFELLGAKGIEKIIIGAENISNDEYEMLSQIIFSTEIQYYDKNKNCWYSVYLEESDLQKDTSEQRQNIELTVIKGERILQV